MQVTSIRDGCVTRDQGHSLPAPARPFDGLAGDGSSDS
jgi:hypothetical protein